MSDLERVREALRGLGLGEELLALAAEDDPRWLDLSKRAERLYSDVVMRLRELEGGSACRP